MKSIITTDKAPGAIGPYSQGTKAGGIVFTSGQLPISPDGHLELDDIKLATKYCLQNVQAVLEEGGAMLTDVTKVTVFLTNITDFVQMNEVYASFFDSEPPARSAVQVAALPKGARIEIEAIAVVS